MVAIDANRTAAGPRDILRKKEPKKANPAKAEVKMVQFLLSKQHSIYHIDKLWSRTRTVPLHLYQRPPSQW